MAEQLLDLFRLNFPSAQQIFTLGPACVLWSAASLLFAGVLKRRLALKTGYTRKVFHFLTFMSIALIHFNSGLPGVFIMGAATSLVVFYSVARGTGNLMYEALAREKDHPRRTYYIITPYFATLLGGILSNLWYGPAALAGYLVAGIADAIAEPIGTRFGRHHYPVPSLRQVKSQRSLEGSAAVFLVSALMLYIFARISSQPDSWALLLTVTGTGLLCAIVEGISPHGWDNTTLQILPSWMAATFLI